MADQYFVNRNGKIFGPFTSEAVKLALSTNKLTSDDLFSTSKEGPWKKLKRPSEAAEPVRQRRSAHGDAEEDFESFGVSSYGPDAEADNISEDYPPLPPRKRKREKVVEEDNPFSSIKGRPAAQSPDALDNVRVASPWQRLHAAFADGLAGFVFVLPGLVVFILAINMAGPRDKDMSALGLVALALMLIGIVALAVCQLYLQVTRAQSVGKWYCNLQIFDVETMQPAGFFKNWILRTFVNGLIAGIPIVGGLYALVDILFVFSENHRCLHDLLAGTQVMDISSVN